VQFVFGKTSLAPNFISFGVLESLVVDDEGIRPVSDVSWLVSVL